MAALPRLPVAAPTAAPTAAPVAAPSVAPALRPAGSAATAKTVMWAEEPAQPMSRAAVAVATVAIAAALVGVVLARRRA